MKITYDENKSQRNIELRQLSFDEARYFEWDTAVIWTDTRFNYSEPRYTALGYLDERIYALSFTPRQDSIRVISFRKANKREIKKYETQRATAI